MRALALASAAALASTGLILMARGGGHESRGRLDDARRLGRRGGFLAFAGCILLGALSPSIPVAAPAVTGGTIALLGGLAGKPRPSWWIAALALGLAGLGYTSGPP